MTERQAIKKSQAHWRRMIKWAKKQNSRDKVSGNKILDEIGECWGTQYCALCNMYYSSLCVRCPLAKKSGRCNNIFSKNLYRKVSYSKTWGKWVKNAKRFYKQQLSKL